jgi:hypothetical protein
VAAAHAQRVGRHQRCRCTSCSSSLRRFRSRRLRARAPATPCRHDLRPKSPGRLGRSPPKVR